MQTTLVLPISIGDLNQKTRDWLLAKSMRLGVPPQEALAHALDAVARKELRAAPTQTTQVKPA
jgi:hypothetical protein